jgi:VanZ family protein
MSHDTSGEEDRRRFLDESELPARVAEYTLRKSGKDSQISTRVPRSAGRRFSKRQQRLLRLLWVLTVLIVIAGSMAPASLMPNRALGAMPFSDNVFHFVAYALLAFLPALHESWRRALLFVLTTGILGVLLEYAQAYSPGRFFELADILSNTWGALSGVVLAVWLRS